MSVIVITKFQGDTAKFRRSPADRPDQFAKIVDAAKSAGALHHRFGIGDGFVLIQDEWDTFEHFQRFFSDPSLQEFIGTVGAAPAPPEITVAEAISSSDPVLARLANGPADHWPH